MGSVTDWTTTCSSVEWDAMNDFTTNPSVDQGNSHTCVWCQPQRRPWQFIPFPKVWIGMILLWSKIRCGSRWRMFHRRLRDDDGATRTFHWSLWSTNHVKQVARISLGASSRRVIQTMRVFLARLLWSELNGHAVAKHNVTEAVKATPGIVVFDAECDARHNKRSTALGLTEKRCGIELLGLKHSIEEHETDLKVVSQGHSDCWRYDEENGLPHPDVLAFAEMETDAGIYVHVRTKRSQFGINPIDDMSRV